METAWHIPGATLLSVLLALTTGGCQSSPTAEELGQTTRPGQEPGQTTRLWQEPGQTTRLGQEPGQSLQEDKDRAVAAGKAFVEAFQTAQRRHGVSDSDLVRYGGAEYVAVLESQRDGYRAFAGKEYAKARECYERAEGLIDDAAGAAARRKKPQESEGVPPD